MALPQEGGTANPTSVPSVAAPTVNRITNSIILLIMTLVCVVLAGFDKNLGRILAVFMGGILLLWVMGPGEGYIQKWIAPLSEKTSLWILSLFLLALIKMILVVAGMFIVLVVVISASFTMV
jgi:hypothetical protein